MPWNIFGIGAGEGNRTLVFSLEVSKNCSVFKGRSDIFGSFGPLRSLQNFLLSEWRLRAPWSQSNPFCSSRKIRKAMGVAPVSAARRCRPPRSHYDGRRQDALPARYHRRDDFALCLPPAFSIAAASERSRFGEARDRL